MKNCENCFWGRVALNDKYFWKCKGGRSFYHLLDRRNIYMNHPKLHGWFCKNYISIQEAELRLEQAQKEIKNANIKVSRKEGKHI